MGNKTGADLAITADSLNEFEPEQTYSGVMSFFRRKYTKEIAGAEVVVSGVPLDTATTNRPGTRFGPQALRRASCSMAWQAAPWPWEHNPATDLKIADFGDATWDFGKPETMPQAVADHARSILASGAKMLTLGGDHFVSYPLLQAHYERHGALSLIHFDAHSDTWEEDEETINHGTMFLHAARKGYIVPEQSVQIGLRTKNPKTHGFNILDGDWVQRHGPDAIAAEIKRIVGGNKAYLTFDIDCLDPSYAPGTGTPVAGGMTSYQALAVLRQLTEVSIIGMDLVEVSPPYDHADMTALAGATLCVEYLALLAARKNRGLD